MKARITELGRLLSAVLLVCAAAAAPLPALAQMAPVDPDRAIDGDLGSRSAPPPTVTPPEPYTAPASAGADYATSGAPAAPSAAPADPAVSGSPLTDSSKTYRKDDLIGAAEGVFGKGAAGLADIIEGLLKKQGEPNAYIVGQEGGGAFVVGLRYGSGTLHHRIEGDRPVYWTGPSLGLDAGANAGKAFVLVYNLHDTQDLYKRFGSGEGQAYLLGGFHVSYLRRKNIVLIPVRMGAGLRLGANVGYMKFSEKLKWMPF